MKDSLTAPRSIVFVFCTVLLIALWGASSRESPPTEEQFLDSAPPSVPPITVRDAGTLEIPGETVLGASTFDAEAGKKYLIQLSIDAEKPADSPGQATYFGYTLSCASDSQGAKGVSAGGTQNLVNGNAVTLGATTLLPGVRGAEYSCRVTVANRHEEVASAGSRVPVALQWTVTPVHDDSKTIKLDHKLPRTVKPGETVDLFREKVLPGAPGDNPPALLANIHSTTCTHMSGSHENGRSWCDEKTLDVSGSRADYRIVSEQSDDSRKCRSESAHDAQIGQLVHHYVTTLTHKVAQNDGCEGPLTVRATVQNNGPAELVVHQQNSTILVIYGL